MYPRVIRACVIGITISFIAGSAEPTTAANTLPSHDREATVERELGDLLGRCKKILEVQTAVHDGIAVLDKAIQSTADKKPNAEHRRAALRLADLQEDAAIMAGKVIDMAEKAGAAVAFPEVFRVLRDEMKIVQARLEITDVSLETQKLESEVMETLKETIEALTKRPGKDTHPVGK